MARSAGPRNPFLLALAVCSGALLLAGVLVGVVAVLGLSRPQAAGPSVALAVAGAALLLSGYIAAVGWLVVAAVRWASPSAPSRPAPASFRRRGSTSFDESGGDFRR